MQTSKKLIIAAVTFSAVIFIAFSDEAAEGIRQSLDICAVSVIPSLFMYMVVTELVISSGAAQLCEKIGAPMTRLFRLPGKCSAAIILGAVCGFPVGAKTAVDLYERKLISKTCAERLMALANNTGPAFVIGVVGGVFWQSRRFGIALYIFQLVSAFLLGVVFSRGQPREKSEGYTTGTTTRSVSAQFSDGVRNAAQNMLYICAFIVFFAALLEMIRVPGEAVLPEEAYTIIASVMEFTAGCRASASLGGLFGAALTGFAIGWSGLSVFAQCAAFASRSGLKMKKMYLFKALQGALCAAMAYAYFLLSPVERFSAASYIIMPDGGMIIVWEVAALCILALVLKKSGRRGC